MDSHWEPFAELVWKPADDGPEAAARRWFTPAIDIVEDGDSFVLDIELPGMRPTDVTVSFEDGVLTIRGERKLEVAEGDAFHRRERAYGAFYRAFSLPPLVDGSQTVAVMAEGVLTLRLPKREPASSMTPSSLDALRRAS
jgi:HSP20 family protein